MDSASGSLWISPNPRVGDNVCIQASNNYSQEVDITISNSIGRTVFSQSCVGTGGTGGAATGGVTCLLFWNTALPDAQGNSVVPGTYLLAASNCLRANFTVSP